MGVSGNKMNVWKNNVSNYYDNCRWGVRLVSEKNVDRDLNKACKELLKWLRNHYQFPIRVPIYLLSRPMIKTRSGKLVSATFLAPYDRLVEPFIKVAVGDYEELKNKCGRDNAIAAIFTSILHELTHYFQWINQVDFNERQAIYYAKKIINDYAMTRDHP